MNALLKGFASFIHEASGGRKADFDGLVMVETSSLESRQDAADYAFANLTNGKQLSVIWDGDKEAPVFSLAPDEHSKSATCTPAETGLSQISLDALVDMALTAYEDWIADEKQAYDEFGGERS